MGPVIKGGGKNSDRARRQKNAGRERSGHAVVTDLEGALRRETRRRRLAERVVRRQSEALAKTLELLVREPALPDFVRAMLRAITGQCGGLWTTLWLVDEPTGEARRAWFQWRDNAIGRSVESFAAGHVPSMRRLGRLYHELIQAHGVTLLMTVEDPRVPRVIRHFYRRIGATGALLVPLMLGKQLLGWISHQRADSGLDPDHVAFVEGMAQQAALAVHLSRLKDMEHEAECARESEQLAREQEREHLAVSRLLNICAIDPADRLGAILRGALENTTELLRGHWSSLWRSSDAEGFAVPAWRGVAGRAVRIPPEEALKLANACRQAHHAWFEKWLTVEEMQFERVDTLRMADLLAAIGAPPPATEDTRLVSVPLWFAGESLGFMLILTGAPPDESSERFAAVKTLAMQVALTLSLDEMSAVQRSAALAEERSRIARDLHDLLAQAFSGIVLQVEAMRVECEGLPSAVVERLEKIRNQAGRSAEELRRTLSMLRPTALDHCTLPEALAMLARETEARSGVRVRFQNKNHAKPHLLAPRAEPHLFAIVSEALQNALSHAAPTLISISLEIVRGNLVVSIINDGVFPEGKAKGGLTGNGHGLSNIRERVSEIGAHFSLRTLRRKTRLEVVAPVDRSISADI